jgi:hypothetical protein
MLLGVAALVLMAGKARAEESQPPPPPAKAHPDGVAAPASASASASTSASAEADDDNSCDAWRPVRRCSCDSGCCDRLHRRCKKPSLSLSVFGVRPALTNVSAGGTTTHDAGVGFAGKVDSYALDGATHGGMEFALGGGQAGFDGTLAGVVDIGYRLDVTKEQGPFARAAFDGRLQGNDAFYYSALELPRMSLGWQFLSGHTVVELGGRSGPILTGRFNPGGGVRSTTGSWEYGAFLAGQVEFIRLEATAMRIDARHTGTHTPVDVGRGALCAIAGPIGICGDFSVMRGDALMSPTLGYQEALATYTGVTVGAASW